MIFSRACFWLCRPVSASECTRPDRTEAPGNCAEDVPMEKSGTYIPGVGTPYDCRKDLRFLRFHFERVCQVIDKTCEINCGAVSAFSPPVSFDRHLHPWRLFGFIRLAPFVIGFCCVRMTVN